MSTTQVDEAPLLPSERSDDTTQRKTRKLDRVQLLLILLVQLSTSRLTRALGATLTRSFS